MSSANLSLRRNSLILALLLFLLGQTSLLLHAVDVSAHAGGGECQTCLLAASGSAALPAIAVIFPLSQGTVSRAIDALPAVFIGDLFQSHTARAPPHSFWF